jgi:hypothetical protein
MAYRARRENQKRRMPLLLTRPLRYCGDGPRMIWLKLEFSKSQLSINTLLGLMPATRVHTYDVKVPRRHNFNQFQTRR